MTSEVDTQPPATPPPREKNTGKLYFFQSCVYWFGLKYSLYQRCTHLRRLNKNKTNKQKIDKWISKSSSKPTRVNNRALREYSIALHFRFKTTPFVMLPHPSPLREQVRKYKSSLELPQFEYIYIRLKYSLQKFGFVYVNYVNERKNYGTKSSQTKQRL